MVVVDIFGVFRLHYFCIDLLFVVGSLENRGFLPKFVLEKKFSECTYILFQII